MRSIFKVTLAGGLLLSATIAGNTQSASPPTPAEQAAGAKQQGSASEATKALKEKLFAVAVKVKTPIFEGKAVPLALQIKKAPQLTQSLAGADVSIAGVSAQGYSQYVTHNGKKIGQAVLTRLTKDERFVELNAENFTSQFDVDDDAIDPAEILEINGNEAELVAALKKLNAEEPEEDEEDKKEKDEEEGEGSNKNGGSGASDGKSENELASAYKTPERREADEEDEEPEEINITEEGCQPVYDKAQNVVTVYNKTQTLKGGVVVKDGTCEPSGKTFTVQKQYGTCPDLVDVEGRKAQPQFQAYYLNDAKERTDLEQCQVDEDMTFKITEKESCPVEVDIEAKTATIITSLVYTDRNNTERTARGCEPSTSLEPLPLTLNTQACSIKHDFAAGQSKEMGTWTYTKNDVTYQASACIDTGNTFPHNKVFKQNGVDVCKVLINMDTQVAIPQERTQITVAGVRQFIDECKPNQSASKDIRATTDTCENPATFTHDLDAGVSYGMERFYYENPDRVYVTDCLQGAATYTHGVKITSWKYNDEELTAQPLSTVSITVAGKEHTIVADALLGGAPEVPYAALEDETVENTAARYYEACNSFVPTSVRKVYERPDGTKHYVAAGEGAPIAEGDKCVREVETVERWFKTVANKGGWVASASVENIHGTRVQIPGGYGSWVSEEDGPYRRPQLVRKNSPTVCAPGSMNLKNYNEIVQRTRITEPDGDISFTDWVRLTEKETDTTYAYEKDPGNGC